MKAIVAAFLSVLACASAASVRIPKTSNIPRPAEAPGVPTTVPRAGMVYRLELVGKTNCESVEYLAARSCPAPGTNALGLADGTAVLLTQWAVQTRPASEGPIIDDAAGTAQLFYLGNINRLDDPIGPATASAVRATIRGRRQRYGGGQRWYNRYARYRPHRHPWPRPPSPGQCHAWLDVLLPRTRQTCPKTSVALTRLGGSFFIQRPAGGSPDHFYIVSAKRQSCPARLLGALNVCRGTAVGLYQDPNPITPTAGRRLVATEHSQRHYWGKPSHGGRVPRPDPRALVRWQFLPICVAQGGKCAAGTRIGCCRDVDPLLDLKCVPESDGSASTVCASPPMPPQNEAVVGAVPTTTSLTVTLSAVAPSDTGGTTAGVLYRARITGAGGSPVYVESSATPVITFVVGRTDDNGLVIGPLCGTDGPATWTIEGQWQNAAGKSEWVPGNPVESSCTPPPQCLANGLLCDDTAAACTTGEDPLCCPRLDDTPPVVVSPTDAPTDLFCNCLPFDKLWPSDPFAECCSQCAKSSDSSKCGYPTGQEGIAVVTDCCSGCLLADSNTCGGAPGFEATGGADSCCDAAAGTVLNKDGDTTFCGCLPGGQAFADGGDPATLCCSGQERGAEPGVCE